MALVRYLFQVGDRATRDTMAGVLASVVDARRSADDEARQRILSCTDPEVLERWLERALTAKTLSDVLGELPQ